MTKENSTDQLLNHQLTTCLQAMQDCLDHSRQARDDGGRGHLRREDVACVAKLMKASARLTEALARLNGQTRLDIRVTRTGEGAPGPGSNTGADKGEG
jgi:hypothetical protein